MALLEPRSQLSLLEAHAVETRNDQQSPLLRLPAEIRNYVYTYACNNLVVSLGTRLESGSESYYLSASDQCDEGRVHDLHRLCGFIFACRKTYAEARLVPFQLNTFCLRTSSIHHFGYVLHESYRRVIESIRIDYFVLFCPEKAHSFEAALLGSFARLRQINVPSCPHPWDPRYPWFMPPDKELSIAVVRRMYGSELFSELQELAERKNEVLWLHDLGNMVLQLVVNLAWMDLELIDVSFVG